MIDGLYYYAGEKTITVGQVDPGLHFSGPSTVEEGRTYQLDLSSTDTSNPNLTWHIDWGDSGSSDPSGESTLATHAYGPGASEPTIRATAADELGTYTASVGPVYDDTFGTNGVVITDLGDLDYANALAVQSDGKIIVAGVAAIPSS